MPDILVILIPFGEIDPTPIKLIADLDITYEIVTSKAVLLRKKRGRGFRGLST